MLRRKKGGLLRVSVSENSLCKDTNSSVQAEFRVIYLCRDCEVLPRPEMYFFVYMIMWIQVVCVWKIRSCPRIISPLSTTPTYPGEWTVIYYAWITELRVLHWLTLLSQLPTSDNFLILEYFRINIYSKFVYARQKLFIVNSLHKKKVTQCFISIVLYSIVSNCLYAQCRIS